MLGSHSARASRDSLRDVTSGLVGRASRLLKVERVEDGPATGRHHGFGLAVLLGLIVLVAAAVLVGRVALHDGPRSGPATQTAFAHVAAPLAAPAGGAPPRRLIIPAISVDAPVAVKGIDQAGVMQSPDGAAEVAWYGFSAAPGDGGNAVFSGHVDYRGVGPAVFARLKDVAPGDVIEVRLADGAAYRYEVSTRDVVRADAGPPDGIIGPADGEIVTLITDAGRWDGAAGQFDARLVVRAQRVP